MDSARSTPDGVEEMILTVMMESGCSLLSLSSLVELTFFVFLSLMERVMNTEMEKY